MSSQTLLENIILRSIKILDIGWSASAYFIMAMFTLFILNKLIIYKEEEENKKSTVRLIVELLLYFWLIGVLIYISRNIYPLIPWPLDGVYGYEHIKTKEVTNAALYGTFLIVFNTNLQRQFNALRIRFDNIFGTKHLDQVILNQ
jgi:hypothetical protein